ncbi:MAG: hypothetical protein ACRDLK_10375 [Gaiellaceae bacterium]
MPARTEELVDTGLEYLPGEPVVIRVVRRERRTNLSDDGRAVELAGRPSGWRDAVERLVERDYALNLSRHGDVFVPVVAAGPGLEPLVRRVAEASRAVHQQLLDLDE